MKITWSDINLQVVAGDEIEVLRGLGDRDSAHIEATKIHNITRGSTATSSLEGIHMTRKPRDLTPPLHGHATNVEIKENEISFDLEEKASPRMSGILRECSKFIELELYERCKDKDYHDVVTNAFPILEDRIRVKAGVDADYSGMKLIDYAFNPNTGVLTLGGTKAEKEALNSLFRGALGFFRNPPSHSLSREGGDVEAFEVISMVDLLLKIVEKSTLYQPPRESRSRSRKTRVTQKLQNKSPEVKMERVRRLQEHSDTIVNKALKPWVSKINEYCKMDTVYSKNLAKMIGLEPRDPVDLEFFDVAKEHLESGYPAVLDAWEKYKKSIYNHNTELATLLEEMRTLVKEELNMPCYYPGLPGRTPEERITIDRFVKSIYREMDWRILVEREWNLGKPKIESVIIGDRVCFQLAWSDFRLVTSFNERKVQVALSLINRLIEMQRFKERVAKLREGQDEISKRTLVNFEAKIVEVIKAVELGNVLEGKCRHCPQTSTRA